MISNHAAKFSIYLHLINLFKSSDNLKFSMVTQKHHGIPLESYKLRVKFCQDFIMPFHQVYVFHLLELLWLTLLKEHSDTLIFKLDRFIKVLTKFPLF